MLSAIANHPDCLTLIDTRPCAIDREISLEGLAAWVYGECDRILTYRELVNVLTQKYGLEVSWDEIRGIVEELRERKVLLELNGRLLSLAVREPILPLLDVKEQPGGYVDVLSYVNDTRKPFWQLFKSKASTQIGTI
jgi:magnesium-protoporphyrin IX monomethyl ester (oxidative) cyclase